MAVLTRSQIENMSHEELVENLVAMSDVSSQIQSLATKFSNLMEKFDQVSSELSITKNVNSLLRERIVTLEKNQLSISQYQRREMLEINPVPMSIENNVLEETVCEALSLTGITVSPDDLQACHRMKNKQRVIVKFTNRKKRQNVISNRKILSNKALELTNLKFSGKLFISDSMCYENHQLAYLCRQLKNAKKIHSTWFFNNVLYIKLTENGNITKIYHKKDIEEVLNVDNLDDFLSNSSF